MQHDFMIKKIGLDPTDPIERQQSLDIFVKEGLIDEKSNSSWSQICLMAKSLTTGEYAACLARDPWKKLTPIDHTSDKPIEKVSFPLKWDV